MTEQRFTARYADRGVVVPFSGKEVFGEARAPVAGTVNGAAALGLAGETGQLAPGFSADLALFEADDVRELPYWYGDRRCRGTWVRGKPCHPYELHLS